MSRISSLTLLVVPLYFVLVGPAPAQERGPQLQPARLVARPNVVSVQAGDSVPFTVAVLDARGETLDIPVRVVVDRKAVRIANGFVKGLNAGSYEIVAITLAPREGGRTPLTLRVPVTVTWPPVERISIEAAPGRLYLGTTLRHIARALHADGTHRPEPAIKWATSDAVTANVDQFGNVTANRTGSVTLSAAFDGVTAQVNYEIVPLPAVELTIEGGVDEVRTGDVQNFTAVARAADGHVLPDVAITWTHAFVPADGIIAPSAPGQLANGKLVADVPGVYTVLATAGTLSARKSFNVVVRDVVQRLTTVGHGRQDTHYTSDFWIFEGRDGRDYALTGARQAQSHAFVWDVTDPANIVKIDSIQVDARSVNDVKVSPDARYGVISREGASNRRNGVVILDLANPAHPTVAATYDDGLTGGVHNVFATNDYLFALSDGDKYVILDMRDIYNPTYVSEYNHPDSRVHDVWVHDGIAYSAEWSTGVVAVDVGNGRWGGTIERPVLVTVFPLPTGATHAVFPYYQESSGRFYLFVGDEIVSRRGLAWEGSGPDHRQPYDPETGRGGYPRATSGYIQIVDFTDPEHPQMVARYEVSEYGTHNIWVESDILYQAYYEGGMRLVDVSGELMGNLYTQGREIAVFKAFDPIGWIPNAPAAWSVMPYKGHIFFSDISSGLWSMKLEPKARPVM